VVIFAVAFVYAKMQGPVPDEELADADADDADVNSSRRA